MNTVYSYPFCNDKEWFDFLECFDEVEQTDIMDISSKALINNKFCKAKLYYITGTFARKWRSLEPDGKRYVFQIGEQENVHGHYINCDITEFLARRNLVPWQKSEYWGCDSAICSSRVKSIHYPQYEKTNEDCWPILWGMIQGLRNYDGKSLDSMNMKDWWDTEKMCWVGPFSIGHLNGLRRFQEFHQSKFLEFIPDRNGLQGKNKVIFSDGSYAALMGHPSMTCTHKGNYFGFLPEGGQPRLFVMDFYTSHEGKLVDNWVQIDMVDLFRSINEKYKGLIDEALYYAR